MRNGSNDDFAAFEDCHGVGIARMVKNTSTKVEADSDGLVAVAGDVKGVDEDAAVDVQDVGFGRQFVSKTFLKNHVECMEGF